MPIVGACRLLIKDGKLATIGGNLVCVGDNVEDCPCCEPLECCTPVPDVLLMIFEDMDNALDGTSVNWDTFQELLGGLNHWEASQEAWIEGGCDLDAPADIIFIVDCTDGIYTLTIFQNDGVPFAGSEDLFGLIIEATSVTCDPFEVVFDFVVDVNGWPVCWTGKAGQRFRFTFIESPF
ncbi:hypothetical protein KC887_00315 [Candidatus Kaiserbacteria bacterium]|nr:hypothetical protein [Candidatus Kaiserbacteria bacterium]